MRAWQRGLRALGLIGLISAVLVGCGQEPPPPAPPQPLIVGRWESGVIHGVITYTPDGRVYGAGTTRLACYQVRGTVLAVAVAGSEGTAVLTSTLVFDGPDRMILRGGAQSAVYQRLDATGALSAAGQEATLDPALQDPATGGCPDPTP